MSRRIFGLAFAVMLAGSPLPATAQVAWDAPFLLPPNAGQEYGFFVLEPAGGDWGVMAMLRPFRLGDWGGLGIRGGIAENEADDLSFFGGVDASGEFLRVDDDVPVDLDWIVGGGLGVGDSGLILSFPIGFTTGRTFTFQGNQFTPYLIPRFIIDVFIGDEDDIDDFEDDIDFDGVVDLGVDARFSAGWLLRFGVNLGDDREGIAIGVLFPN